MEDIQKIAGSSFVVLHASMFVNILLKSHDKLVSIVRNEEANELLGQDEQIFHIFSDRNVPA